MADKPFKSPPKDCDLCGRLVAFRQDNQKLFPDKFNGAVPSFGNIDAQLLVVGLAPGLKGANFTGRPFTGDYAGDLLYPSLIEHGFATGVFDARPDDGLTLVNTRITNAVRCVPPQNKPTTDEIKTCRDFLINEIKAMPRLKVLLALGRIAHDSVLRTLSIPLKNHAFGHGNIHELGTYTLIDSYHCSRYNVNTGRLDADMFGAVLTSIKGCLEHGTN
tara:strand:+ start:96 stop:749 length:654 start_codon:yes stop_codon:yes gene_type:complete